MRRIIGAEIHGAEDGNRCRLARSMASRHASTFTKRSLMAANSRAHVFASVSMRLLTWAKPSWIRFSIRSKRLAPAPARAQSRSSTDRTARPSRHSRHRRSPGLCGIRDCGGIDGTGNLRYIAPSHRECLLHRRCVSYLKPHDGAAKQPPAARNRLEHLGCRRYPISRSLTTFCVRLELKSRPSTGITRLHRYNEPLRLPTAPGLFLTGVRLVIPTLCEACRGPDQT
jgi:hypothetical protein